LGESERYASIIKGSQARIRNNEEKLPLISLREAVSFRARMRHVVATRLQAQHSSFWLCISSNTPAVLTNDAHGPFANFDEEMQFSSCNFCLKKRLGELHNSRQGCNLDELNNQSEPTRSLVSHIRI
jgi:hypothetical protein